MDELPQEEMMSTLNATETYSHNSSEEWDEMGLEFFYGLATINLMICVIGLAGNVLVFYVVCRFSAMQTVTNVFILALAFADIAFLVNIPLLVVTSLIGEWWFGNIYCKIYYSVTTINQFASSFLLVVMSADRYLAICLPAWSRRIRTRGAAVGMCIFVWMIAVGLMYPVFMYSGSETSVETGRTQCNILWPTTENVDGHKGFALYCFVLGFALPVYLMMTFYGCVLRKLRSSHEKVAAASSVPVKASAAAIKRQAKLRKVTMMVFAVIAVYLLCWSPYWIFQMLIVFGFDEDSPSSDIIYACLSLQCLCFANSSINPILYAVLSDNFKKSYARAFQGRRASRQGVQPLTAANPLIYIRAPASSMVRSDSVLPSFYPKPSSLQTWLTAEVLLEIRTGVLVAL